MLFIGELQLLTLASFIFYNKYNYVAVYEKNLTSSSNNTETNHTLIFLPSTLRYRCDL